MTAKEHPGRGDLIDFAEGETSSRRSKQIEAHLKVCEVCRSHVASIEGAFSLLGTDTVPEPSPGYWAYFEQRVRERVRSQRRPLVFSLVPGLAAAATLLVLLWWLPQAQVPGMRGVEMIMADMTTGEIVEAVSDGPYVGLVLLGAAEEDIRLVETYLAETEAIYDLVDQLSEAEKENFINRLRESMQELEGTQYFVPADEERGVEIEKTYLMDRSLRCAGRDCWST